MIKNKGIIGIGLILAIVLGIVIVGGGAYYLGKSGNKQEVNNPADYLPNNQNQNLPVDNNQQVNVPTPTIPVVSTDCTSSSKPSIIVISPNGGEVYKAGDKVTVKWSSCNGSLDSSQVMIILKSTQSSFGSEIATVPNTGTATITLPTSLGGGQVSLVSGKYYKILTQLGGNAMGYTAPTDLSDNSFTINSGTNIVNLSTFSSKYISPYPGQWPPVVQHNTTAYSCSTILRDVFDTPTTLTGKQKNINGRTFCIYSDSDVGAGHAAGVYTYITTGLNGSGTERVDFRLDWPNGCGVYGTTGDQEYDQCKNDQSTFFNNLDAYIASLM